jgi:hypothetical protein
MKKMLLTGGLIAAAALLSGCMVISCDEQRLVRRPCVIGSPPCRVVGVVVIPREAGPRSNDPRPRAWHRPSSALASCLAEKPGYNDPQPDGQNESLDRTKTRGVARL